MLTDDCLKSPIKGWLSDEPLENTLKKVPKVGIHCLHSVTSKGQTLEAYSCEVIPIRKCCWCGQEFGGRHGEYLK